MNCSKHVPVPSHRYGMWGVFTIIMAMTCVSVLCKANEEDQDLSSLSPEAFLEEVRRPLQQDAWGTVEGRLVHASGGEQQKATIKVRMTFSHDSLHAQIELNGTNVYGFEQIHNAPPGERTRLDLPDTETPPSLFSFGVEPEDLTFAFIYWDFVKEHPRAHFHRRLCRVFELRHPDAAKGTVHVWFSAQYGFPLKAEWFKTDASTPWRTMELKGAKKHANDLWFVKEMRLEGEGWKTQVKFVDVALNPLGEKATRKE